MRRAKIVATLGPASNTIEKISALIKAGMNVARVNMSHGTHESHTQLIKNIRQASLNVKQEVAVLIDLQGPKIRVDKVDKPLELKDGSSWVIGESKNIEKYPEYKDCYIPTIYDKLVDDCHDGARILFDDGLISAEAVERDRDVYKIKINVGGFLKSNKGINLPDCDVSAPAFTAKDKEDLLFGLENGADYLALSFVRRKEDVEEVKFLLHKLKKNIPIISKIEKPQAIDHLDEIMEVTDVIMVARGDMGVEVGNHLVPSVQKKIIKKCNERGIPVITATQMLESMTENPTPTRAEASDVANAIWDGTDAVMLSGESASGKYPVETVSMMSKIIEVAELDPKERPLLRNMDLSNVNASVMVAASMIAEKVDAKRILSVTESGHSCLKISFFRPKTEVLGITNHLETVRRLCLYWGVTPYRLFDYNEDDFNFQKDVINKVKEDVGLVNGDKLVITRGDGRFFSRGSSNSVKVEIIKDAPKVPGGQDSLSEASDDKKKILLDNSICASCQNCVHICPHDIWKVSDNDRRTTYINEAKISECTMDYECIRVCPTGAIEIIPMNN
ncbi:pyruvate kinase [Bacteriovoracaceae bacterium]|nr:pyruvate kinase [Bacteriovoracaceae bacterium]|tara:strand:+ start:116018 stop:117700 length:1683 start_codon:yes stop_codon:yes gene_type:complete